MKIPATIEWVRAFDAQAIEDDLPHLGALCVFMFGTARIGEACRMIWGDVDLHQRTAKLYLFKPAPWSREAHLPPELVAVLANLPSNRKADELVFDYSGRVEQRLQAGGHPAADTALQPPRLCNLDAAYGNGREDRGRDGRLKDAATVLRTYAHAVKDKTITDALFDTPATRGAINGSATVRTERKKRNDCSPSLGGVSRRGQTTAAGTGAREIFGLDPGLADPRKEQPMFTVSLITAPANANLESALLDGLSRSWDGGTPRWLNPGIAGEFDIGTMPTDVDQVWSDLQTIGIDMAIQPGTGRRKSILLADMDSTMIGQECVDELADMAGVGPRVAAITARAMNGELNFHEALVERVGLLAGLRESVVAEVLDRRITLTPGGRELVATMRANGGHAALVSGGFTAFTGAVAERLGFDTHRANTLLSEAGVLTGHVALPVLGREAKVEALREIAAGLGRTPEDAIAVGDGANDLGMLQLAGTGVALHAKPVVAAQAKIRINHGDLSALLYLQGYRAAEFVGG